MVVMKFGGTSVIDAQQMQKVAALVVSSSQEEETVVILSAMKGTTETLLAAANSAAESDHSLSEKNYEKSYELICTRHENAWNELCTQIIDKEIPLPESIDKILFELEEILHGIYLIKECTDRTRDLMLSFGERLSCALFSEYMLLRKEQEHDFPHACFVDAREHIVTNESHGDAGVHFQETYRNLNEEIVSKLFSNKSEKVIPVVTGFIASTKEGVTTTLGRNGSDYSAALVGAAIGAGRIEIWTDVDGVLSADPRIVSGAFVVPRISYSEAMELSYFGAKVIHPQTVVPAVEKNIPIVIKNTMNPSARGTIIAVAEEYHDFPITGVASVKDVGILTIEGAGLTGNFYFLPDVFTVFARHDVQPLMITQSSSEHSISFILNTKDVARIKEKLQEHFEEELSQKKIQDISTRIQLSIISVIGSHMKGTMGLSGKIFSAMGTKHINVIAIAQGSNEMNVSFVVSQEKEQEAIQILHKEFFNA